MLQGFFPQFPKNDKIIAWIGHSGDDFLCDVRQRVRPAAYGRRWAVLRPAVQGISVILLYSIRRSSPFYFSEIALVAVFPLHLTGICGMIQDVFLFLFAAAMPEGSPARRQGNGSNTHTFLLETERTRYIWDSLRKFSERTVSGS